MEEMSPAAPLPPYEIFARVYDEYMRNVPYNRWASYMLDQARLWLGRAPEDALDLGCGTGLFLEKLFVLNRALRDGRGIDRSDAMLARARERVPRGRFTKGELIGPLPYADDSRAWILCTHDSLNYLLEVNDLRAHFREVTRVLRPGGIYGLDVVSLSNIRKNHSRNKKTYRLPPYRLDWFNHYEAASGLLRTELHFTERNAELLIENHVQRYHTPEDLTELGRAAGLEPVVQHGNYEPRDYRKSDLLVNLIFQKPGRTQARSNFAER